MNFADLLISWYNNNKRDLPWRATTDLYHIWVSEIILQQTRIAQGTIYYFRFLTRFPDLQSLADANESDVLKIWQGLGYYSRARNMHTAAKQILSEHAGIFPSDYKSLVKIKGIGAYTASALLSFGYNLPFPVIDGNVKRVISRLFAIESPINTSAAEALFSEKLNVLFDKNNPAIFNQAIMEFGALQCKPGIPDCTICVFKKICLAFEKDAVMQYPQIIRKTVETRRYFYYIVPVFYRQKTPFTFLQRRNANDIWKNLFEFPLIETENTISTKEILISEKFKQIFSVADYKLVSVSETLTHKLTHQIIYAQFIRIEIVTNKIRIELPEIKLSELHSFPVSRLTDKYLNSIDYFGL